MSIDSAGSPACLAVQWHRGAAADHVAAVVTVEPPVRDNAGGGTEDAPDPAETVRLGRRLDRHHEPVMTGVIAICAICAVSVDDGFVSGLRHHPADNELSRTRRYLANFAPDDAPPPSA